MNYKKISLFLFSVICFLLTVHSATAQSLQRVCIGSMGSSINLEDNLLLRQTIGQTAGVTIFSDNEGILLRQGFQQPEEMTTPSEEKQLCEYSLSPNPTQNQFNFILSKTVGKYTVYVYDANGRLYKTIPNLELNTQPIDVTTWTPGLYYIQANDQSTYLCTKKIMIIQ